MNKQEILTAINKTIKGQGSAVDVGGKLAAILESIIDLIPAPAEQVNSDWNATEGPAEILNKPTIPAAQVNSDWNATEGPAEILNKPTIPEGPLVCPITIGGTDNEVTLLDGAPTKAEILGALRSGRQVIGLEYDGNNIIRQMLCTAKELNAIDRTAFFFSIDSATIEHFGYLTL